MKYQKIEDLLSDPSFARWVKKTNPNDIVIWENWIKDNPQHLRMVQEARDIILGIRFSPTQLSEEKVQIELEKLQNKIESVAPSKVVSIAKKQRKWTGIAASIIFLVGAVGLFFLFNQSQPIIHTTTFGEQIDLKLSDGTQVALNANSSIKYFEENPREVWLNGEAFFNVEKKPSTGEHFLVKTDDLTVQVLGTAFNVHTRLEKTQVVLEEGKVNLQLDNGKEKEMEPGDLVTFSSKLNKVLEDKKAKKVEIHTSWKDGNLLLEDVSLEEAMNQISDIYGVKIQFSNNTISNKRIRTGVPTDNLEICIQIMEIACGITIKQTDKTLIISTLD